MRWGQCKNELAASIVQACKAFMVPGARRPVREFWRIEGHINWALNVYRLLKPATSALYAKTAGKTAPYAELRINKAIACEMSWFVQHIERLPGIHLLTSTE